MKLIISSLFVSIAAVSAAQNLRSVNEERKLGFLDGFREWWNNKEAVDCTDQGAKENIACGLPMGKTGVVACVGMDLGGIGEGMFADEDFQMSVCMDPRLLSSVSQCGTCDGDELPEQCKPDSSCGDGEVKVKFTRDLSGVMPMPLDMEHCVPASMGLTLTLTPFYECAPVDEP